MRLLTELWWINRRIVAADAAEAAKVEAQIAAAAKSAAAAKTTDVSAKYAALYEAGLKGPELEKQ